MLEEVERQLDPRTLSLALGADERELDWIRAGHQPEGDTLERLRLLHRTSLEADLRDPRAVFAALLGDAEATSPAGGLALLWRGPYRWALIAFVALDALLLLAVAVYVLRSF